MSFYLLSRYGLPSVWLFEGHIIHITVMRTRLTLEELLDLEVLGQLSAAIHSVQCVHWAIISRTLAFVVLTLVVMKTGPWGKTTSPTLFLLAIWSGIWGGSICELREKETHENWLFENVSLLMQQKASNKQEPFIMTKVIFQQWGGFSNIITAESRYQVVVMTRNYFLLSITSIFSPSITPFFHSC